VFYKFHIYIGTSSAIWLQSETRGGLHGCHMKEGREEGLAEKRGWQRRGVAEKRVAEKGIIFIDFICF
jgi:hypothetical protein